MIPIRAAPFAAFFFMIGMDHTNRAPGEFQIFFIFLHHDLFDKTGLAAECKSSTPVIVLGARTMPFFRYGPHIYGFITW